MLAYNCCITIIADFAWQRGLHRASLNLPQCICKSSPAWLWLCEVDLYLRLPKLDLPFCTFLFQPSSTSIDWNTQSATWDAKWDCGAALGHRELTAGEQVRLPESLLIPQSQCYGRDTVVSTRGGSFIHQICITRALWGKHWKCKLFGRRLTLSGSLERSGICCRFFSLRRKSSFVPLRNGSPSPKLFEHFKLPSHSMFLFTESWLLSLYLFSFFPFFLLCAVLFASFTCQDPMFIKCRDFHK